MRGPVPGATGAQPRTGGLAVTIRGILPVLALVAAGLTTASAAPQVRNGGMEGPPEDHSEGQGLLVTPAAWTPVNVNTARGDRLSVEPSDRPGGGQCLRVNTSGNDAGVYQTIAPLEQGTTYLVSAWVKRLSGALVIEAYPHAWGPAVMRRVDGESQGWRRMTVPLTPIDAGAHLYLVASRKADFLIDDVEVRPAPVRVGDPTAQPYDLTDAWRYRVTFSRVAPAADGQPAEGPFDVLVRAVPEHGPASALAPAQRATLGPGATAEIELRLPFAEGEPAFAVEVTDAATGEVLGGSALVRQLGDPWDVRYPYKNALFHTTGLRWPVVVHVRRTPRAVVSRLRATATLRDGRGRVVRSVESAFARDGLRLPLTGSDLACGAYELTVVVSDETGRPLRRETRPLRVLPTAPHEVALTPEGDLLVDGEAFFPIGLYWVFANPDDWKPGPARKDAEFLELRRAGFNTLHSYAFEHNDANDTDENALAYLDTAQEFGFKVMMGLRRDWYQGEAVDLGAIERRVLALKDHPSLLCWTLWDEPNFDPDFSAPRVRAMYDLLDRLDPYHPAMPVFGGPDAGAFRDCADVFLFDHYPGRGGGASVARAMDRARESLPEKPIWFVAQAFRSGGQLPTEEDMGLFWRNALERGARAVFWYSYGGGAYQWDSVRTDPAHWEAVKRVVSELARATSPASRFE